MIKINEKKELRKQLIKNVFLNFIIFTLLLLVFDVIIYNQVKESWHQDIEKPLEMTMGLNLNEDPNNPNSRTEIDIYNSLNPKQIMLENLLNILVVGTLILVFVSIIASYFLSKRTMKPIVDAYKKQTEFVQNASHELRTPLTIIQAKEELLLTEPNAKIIDKSEDINLVLKETKRLTKLIKELMDLARGDEDNIELQKELTNINDLIKEVVEPYCDLAKIQDKTIELDLKCNKEIKVNKNKISELLIIILDNAIKYTNKSDKIIVKTYYKDSKCNIEIQDTGIGISDESINHIFDRFYREDKARSRETGGNGLGLSIAKMIVNLHSGTISALHNKPKGTIIKIKI